MNDTSDTVQTTEAEPSLLAQHRFLLLIGLTIVVAIGLVIVSMTIYNVSGAAQLDLSRPGYKSVVSQANDDESDFQTYDASGPVNATTISQFQNLYNTQAKTITQVNAFGGDPLNPNTLEFGSSSSSSS